VVIKSRPLYDLARLIFRAVICELMDCIGWALD
jgi:hypothetical protein